MTLGADARVPRLGLPTIAPLVLGPRGWRTPLRDAPGVLRGRGARARRPGARAPAERAARRERRREGHRHRPRARPLRARWRAVMDAPAADLVPGVGRARAAPAHAHRRRQGRAHRLRPRAARPTASASSSSPSRRSSSRRRRSTTALIASLVSQIELGVIDSSKTAIGDAVGTAVARMRRSNARSKAVVLLTDGDSNEGVISPEYSAHLAQKEGVRVYTVQIGNGDDVDVQTGIDLFGQPRLRAQALPGEPGAPADDVARDRRRGVHRDRQVGAREQHALDPRPPREDEVRVAGVDDGRPLPVPARARPSCSSRSRRSCGWRSCGGSREVGPRLRVARRASSWPRSARWRSSATPAPSSWASVRQARAARTFGEPGHRRAARDLRRDRRAAR